jgi:hypothetical protein
VGCVPWGGRAARIMDLPNTLKELREELAQINAGIEAMERMDAGRRRGPGRPPKWVADANTKQKRDARPAVSKSAAAKEA